MALLRNNGSYNFIFFDKECLKLILSNSILVIRAELQCFHFTIRQIVQQMYSSEKKSTHYRNVSPSCGIGKRTEYALANLAGLTFF